MTGGSLDGRSKASGNPHVKSKHHTKKNPNAPHLEHLRPASPPKTNPWLKKRPAASSTPDWPTVTPDFENVNSTVETGHSEEPKSEEASCMDTNSSLCTDSQASNSISPSRELPPWTMESMWKWPIGADILVRVGPETFKVHRCVVEAQSGWFRDNLPPTNLWEAEIEVDLPFCYEAARHTLRFMYTKRLEILEYDREDPDDLIHVLRSALLFVGAVDLGVEAMMDHIVRVLQQATQDLTTYLLKSFSGNTIDQDKVVKTVNHLGLAIEAAYAYESQEETGPLRLALASILDVLFPWLIQHEVFLDSLSGKIWRRYSASISADLIQVRQSQG